MDSGSAPVPDFGEMIGRLTARVDDSLHREQESVRRAEAEQQRADRLAAKLRELGIDPDSV